MLGYKLSEQKEKLLRQDIERYLMGQTRLIDIAKNRSVSIHVLQKIQGKIIMEKLTSVRKNQ